MFLFCDIFFFFVLMKKFRTFQIILYTILFFWFLSENLAKILDKNQKNRIKNKIIDCIFSMK